MKKITAIILSLVFVLSLAACTAETNTQNDDTSKSSQSVSSESTDTSSITSEKEDINSTLPDVSFDDVTSLEDFADKLKEEGYETIIEEQEDGTIIVDLGKKPEKDEDKIIDTTTTKPAIPTIDITEEPTTPTPTPQPTPDPVTPAPTPDPEPVTPEPTPTPDPEPVTPAPTPTPTPDPTPTTPTEPEKPSKVEYTYTTGQKHEKLHYTERHLYSILNAQQKEVYRTIDTAVTNLEESVFVDYDLYENSDYYILYTYIFDNPEHFYLCNRMSLCNYGNGKFEITFCYAVGNQKGEYCGYGYGALTEELKTKIKNKKAIFEAEANRILSTIPANAPDVWKERLIYDRILMDGHYNLDALNGLWDGLANDNWTAYGLLVNKYGVCESYSEAFQTLCLYAGIKCTGVVGTAGGGHKWNAVELDGEWYMCDITFDDPIGGREGAAYHYYFNRTSGWFTEHNHDWSNCEYDVPQCNGTKYDFEAYFGGSRW